MTHPSMPLRGCALAFREGGHILRSGQASPADVAGMACAAASRTALPRASQATRREMEH
jgi:hypothetical protein